MYALLSPLLLRLPAEPVHDATIALLQLGGLLQLDRLAPAPVSDPVKLMGLQFANRVGLAAGLDKNGDALEMLGACGFGFLELGTVTPRPQPGNPRPRLFRLPEARALINRMGFNNLGVEHLLRRVQLRRYPGVLGVNLGKNRDTPAGRALADYSAGLQAVHQDADYVTLNLSSPNTPGLRDLQVGAALEDLLQGLQPVRDRLADRDGRRTPMLVKIAPDLHADDVRAIADQLMSHQVDGIIATNTTLARDGVEHLAQANEAGGLSGAPLHERSLDVVRTLRRHVGQDLVVVGVGGIDSANRAQAMYRAGADLVQLYSGLIYRGPGLVRQAARALAVTRGRDY